jgi:cellulose synthase operon protein C
MRQTLLIATLLAAPFCLSLADDKPVEKKSTRPFPDARKLLMKGNYEEAREAYEEGAKKQPKFAAVAAVGIARSHFWAGEYDKAIDALDASLKSIAEQPDLLAEKAEVLYTLGRWDEASKLADQAIAKAENQLLARWVKAKTLRDRGETEEADKAIRWIVRYYTARSNADNDITDPDELIIVAQAGAENARWHGISRQFSFILNEVIADILKQEAEYWPAELLAGQMLLEKYNRPDGVEAFEKALKINPKIVDAIVGKGLGAMQRFELKEVDQMADQALKIDPKHPGALRLKADVYLVASDLDKANELLKKAKERNPRDAATLGRLAAIHLMANRQTEFDKVVKEVASFDKAPGSFYFELAECLEERKRYNQAEGYYKKAAELRPMMAGPRNSLGLLYMRLGDEKTGREILTKALEQDPFNVRVANSLKVLRHLDKYKTLQTAHYELRYNPETDQILAEFIGEFLEESHAELKRQFGYEPPGRVLIEVFNTHEMFSGRTVGLPDLHTIGACTGKIVAMASPTAKGVRKPFNWGRVIRHELTHIFNLIQTDFLCPHWLTEGLAVRNEQMARPPQWTSVLRDRFREKTLFNLDTVMLGFARPKNPDEWALAYCQSHLYVEYLIKTHGEPAVGKLLDAYRQGKTTAQAISIACGVEQDTFEKGYLAYVAEIVKPYLKAGPAKEEEKQLTFAELEEKHKDNPDDIEVAAKLAEQLLRRNKVSESRKLVDMVLMKKKGHPIATLVKARLLVRGGDEEGAKAALEEALTISPEDGKLLLAISRLYIENKDYENAAQVLEKGRKIAPLDGDWLEQLARIYKMTNDTEKLIGVLRELVSHDPDELDGRIRLAKVSLEAGRSEDAERFAKDALQIDVMNEEARKALTEALKGQGKTKEAETLNNRFDRKQ